MNISACIPVVRSVRDLGGTINTVGRSYAKVIDARIVQSLSTLRKFRHLPHDGKTKALFIQSKILQAALYGIESAEPSGHLLRKLQSGIAGMLGSQSARACNALTFDLNNYGIDLDPHIQQFTRRVSLMRRMVSKHPHIRDTIFELWDIYQKGKTPGTLTPGTNFSSQPSAPPPGHQGRASWKPTRTAHGPIALILFSVNQAASALDRDFRLHRFGHDPLDVLNVPHQTLRAQLEQVAVEARTSWVATTREHLEGVGDIDRVVMTKALDKRSESEKRVLKHFMSLASWSNDKLCEAGFLSSPRCELCGHERQTTIHLLYECPALECQRTQAMAYIPQINIKDLPWPFS